MRIEDELTAALEQPPRAEPSFTDDWDSFHRRARRHAVASKTMAVSAVLVPLMAFAGVVAVVRQGPAWTRMGDPGALMGGERITDARAGYEVTVPAGWSDDVLGGARMMEAPDGSVRMVLRAERPRDFDEVVEHHRARAARQASVRPVDPAPGEGAITWQVEEHAWRIGDLDAVSFAWTAIGMTRELIQIDTYIDLGPGTVLAASVSATQPATWQTLEAHGDAFARGAPAAMSSVRSIKAFGLVADAPRGWFAASVELDEVARGFERFLEARVARDDAERFLSRAAAEVYLDEVTRPHLYHYAYLQLDAQPEVVDEDGTRRVTVGGRIEGDGSGGGRLMKDPFYRFEVTERHELSGDRTAFTVRLYYRETPIGENFTLERIVVRRDGSSIVVLSVDERGGGSMGR